MTAGRFNITIEQGATFTLPFTIADTISGSSVPRNLTGMTARMKIKETIDDSTALVELTTSNGGIVFANQSTNPGEGYITISATATAALDFDRGVYDLELVDSAIVSRILQGKVIFRREVTD